MASANSRIRARIKQPVRIHSFQFNCAHQKSLSTSRYQRQCLLPVLRLNSSKPPEEGDAIAGHIGVWPLGGKALELSTRTSSAISSSGLDSSLQILFHLADSGLGDGFGLGTGLYAAQENLFALETLITAHLNSSGIGKR